MNFQRRTVYLKEKQICQAEQISARVDDALLIDVRSPAEIGVLGTIDEALNIPVNLLRANLDRLPKDRPLVVFCAVGLRGYVAYRLLNNLGYQVRNLTGGFTTYQMVKRIGI